MGRSTAFGLRTAGATGASAPTTTPATHKSGQRGVPANYGGRHHMGSRGPASLSEMMPRRPQGMNPAAKQYGGRHHYGEEIRGQMKREASSPDNVAEMVATAMFGALDGDDELDALLSEAESLIGDIEDDH